MVKNTKGGNKAKKQGRKFAQPKDPNQIKARFSSDPDEIYACCTKQLGNGMCRVICIDGIERICVIRKKFKGRGRRDNTLNMGTWCLVGKRSFETSVEGKLDKTDLLEVYSDIEKKKVIEKEVHLKDKWKTFSVYESKSEDVEIEFQSNTYPELPEGESSEEEEENDDTFGVSDYTKPIQKPKKTESLNSKLNEEEIDVDDI